MFPLFYQASKYPLLGILSIESNQSAKALPGSTSAPTILLAASPANTLAANLSPNFSNSSFNLVNTFFG